MTAQAVKQKKKGFPEMSLSMWRDVCEPNSPLLAQILENENWCDDMIVQLGASVRNGVIAACPPSLRAHIIGVFERNCVLLCRGSDNNRVRMIYETLRDHISNSNRDGSKLASQLRDSAIRSLTAVIIRLDLPKRDPRLTRFHVEMLYKLLKGRGTVGPITDTTTEDFLMDKRLLAADCLQSLESAYPTLLAADASSFAALALKEIDRPTPGYVYTQLAASVISNVSQSYLNQQHEITDSLASPAATYDDDDSTSSVDSDHETEDVLTAAAEVLYIPKSIASKSVYDDEDGVEIEFETQEDGDGASSSARASARASASNNSTLNPKTLNPTTDQATPKPSQSHDTSETSSPRDILTRGGATINSSVASVASKQSSRRSMLASVAELPAGELEDDGDSSTAIQRRSTGSGNVVPPVPTSALTGAIRWTASSTPSISAPLSWTGTSTPRSIPSEMVLLRNFTTKEGVGGDDLEIPKRFSVPMHIQTGDLSTAPRYIVLSETQEALTEAAKLFINTMRRLGPGNIASMSKSLPAILRAARPSSIQLWPLFERQLSTGNTHLLRAVLDLHDTLPELFEGRGPSLVEKVLHQVNDHTLSADHRVAAASWVLRQHASQRHNGGDLLLADSWEQLLPLPKDPPQLAAIKVKALGACLSAGIGDEDVVCRSVCLWDGFGSTRRNPTEQQLRAFTYALRILHSSAPEQGPSAHRTYACLVAGMLEALVAKPHVARGIDTFLETCSDSFATLFLRAFNALLSGVDGQFEALKERPEDAPFKGSTSDLMDRVKTALITRASSLSGMMRGLSFSLSFSKRNHSVVMPMTTARSHSVAVTPRRSSQYQQGASNPHVDVHSLRSTVSAAFRDTTTNSTTPTINNNNNNNNNTYKTESVGTANGKRSNQAQRKVPVSFPLSGDEQSLLLSDDDVIKPTAPAVPLDLLTQDAVETWTSSPGTWEVLAVGMLAHDLLAYRLLLRRVLSSLDVHPCGTLRTLANYTWQYKEYHPCHALPAKQAGGAILGLCHAAAVTHLPCASHDSSGWILRQTQVASQIQNVLDAVEEGFPVVCVQERCQILSTLVAQEEAWIEDAWPRTLTKMLDGFIDMAVQG